MSETYTITVKKNQLEAINQAITDYHAVQTETDNRYTTLELIFDSDNISPELLAHIALNIKFCSDLSKLVFQKPLPLTKDNFRDYQNCLSLFHFNMKTPEIDLQTETDKYHQQMSEQLDRVNKNIILRSSSTHKFDQSKLMLFLALTLIAYSAYSSAKKDGIVSLNFLIKCCVALAPAIVAFSKYEHGNNEADKYVKTVRYEKKLCERACLKLAGLEKIKLEKDTQTTTIEKGSTKQRKGHKFFEGLENTDKEPSNGPMAYSPS